MANKSIGTRATKVKKTLTRLARSAPAWGETASKTLGAAKKIADEGVHLLESYVGSTKGTRKSPAKKKGAAKKRAPAKKGAAKKRAPAKKSAAKKRAPAKKGAAKKRAPAKKSAAKKRAPARKSPAKKKSAARKRG